MFGSWHQGGTEDGGAQDTRRRLRGPAQGRCTVAMESDGGKMHSNSSDFVLIAPPVFGTTVNQGVTLRGMGGETEEGKEIN